MSLTKQSVNRALDKAFSPYVSLTQIDDGWYPTTANDAHTLQAITVDSRGMYPFIFPIATTQLDALLDVVSAAGYILETILEYTGETDDAD